MKVRRNYTLELALVQELDRRVKNQSKSQFVENAIRARLNKQSEFSLRDYSDEDLLLNILSRNWNRDSTSNLNPVLFEAIKLVLKINI